MGDAEPSSRRKLATGVVAATAVTGVAVATAWWLVHADVTTIDDPATVNAPAERLGTTAPPSPGGSNRSLRFFGTGSGGIDRVVVPIGAGTAANVGAGDFTVEFWIKGSAAANPAGGCNTANDHWINGHVVVDRDVYFGGDLGDYGISLLGGRIAFGVSKGTSGATVCGATSVLDDAWHHVAVTRRASDGQLRIFVDGVADGQVASSAATGDVSYRVGRSTSYPADPSLVFGAEKHDAGSSYPSFDGLLDEVRLSTVLRYTAGFTRPAGRFTLDASTAALYHFDDGSGTGAADAAGTSPGTLHVGGPSSGPQWSLDVPFT